MAEGAAGSDARVAHDNLSVGGDAGGVGFIACAEEAEAGHHAGLMDEGFRLA